MNARRYLRLFGVWTGVAVLAGAGLARVHAPEAAAAANPVTSTLRGFYDGVRQNVIESAEMLPEQDYGFKPTASVRTFGEIVAHLADDNYLHCSIARGEPSPDRSAIAKMTSKEGLTKALKASFDYCTATFDAMNDGKLVEEVPAGSGRSTRIRYLVLLVTHNTEHYGNFVTYLRMKGLVPPSTARQPRRSN